MFQSWHETFTNLEKVHYVKRNVEQSNYITNTFVHIMQMTSRKQNNDFFYNFDYDHQPNYNYSSTLYLNYYLTDPHGEHV